MRVKLSTKYGLLICFLVCVVVLQWSQTLWIYGKAEVAQYLIDLAWHKTLANSDVPKLPWQWADTWPVMRLQWDGNNLASAEDLFVLSGSDGSALAFGPGHMANTANAGEGTTVIAGHRDTHFAFLENVSVGEQLSLQDRQGQWLHYRIEDISVFDSQGSPLMIDPELNALVLITCYPFDSISVGGPLRYVVSALAE